MVRRVTAWLLLLAACGGSSAESPWPPEPPDVDLGPAGEREAEARRPATPERRSGPTNTGGSAAPSARPASSVTPINPREP
jgi:hypothetical protein